MAPSIGLNLRVTGYKHQGGRRYMEDDFGVAYQQTSDEKDLEYAFFGIFDGHGGREAALFAKEHLMEFIVSQKGFWEEDDESVLKAIREGFIQTHYAMWKELEKWPKTASGLPSTAGTTASISFIRRGKIYIGHVGDSAIVLGVQDPDDPDVWRAEPLTTDHKPESLVEHERIQQCGGKVICKSGVPRVVWNRPKMGHKGPVRRSTHIDEIPFLAVARSLGDLWSYNSEENVFVVSPEPDIQVYPVDITKHRCLILGTDGAWNMLTSQKAISTVCRAEKSNEQHMLNPVEGRTAWINPSKQLVDTAIERWNSSKLRADNTSVVTVMLDPPGPPRAQVLNNRKRELAALNAGKDLLSLTGEAGSSADRGSVALVTNRTHDEQNNAGCSGGRPVATCIGMPLGMPSPAATGSVATSSNSEEQPTGSDSAGSSMVPKLKSGCSIISRFPNSSEPGHSEGFDLIKQKRAEANDRSGPLLSTSGSSPTTGKPLQGGGSGRLSDSTLVMVSPAGTTSTLATTSAITATSTNNSNSSCSRVVAPNHIVQCNEVSSSGDSPTRRTTDQPLSDCRVESGSSSSDVPIGNSAGRLSSPPPVSSNSPLAELNSEPSSSLGKIVTSPPLKRTNKKSVGGAKSATGNLKSARKSLSRELNALQLSSRRTTRGSSIRLRTASENSSDAENDQTLILTQNTKVTPIQLRKPRGGATKSTFVRQRAQEINASIAEQASNVIATSAAGVKSYDATTHRRSARIEVTGQDNVGMLSHNLRSASKIGTAVVTTPAVVTPRTLRSQQAAHRVSVTRSTGVSATPRTALKRKLCPITETGRTAAKSPRTVTNKVPIVTRSRQATVLRLKK